MPQDSCDGKKKEKKLNIKYKGVLVCNNPSIILKPYIPTYTNKEFIIALLKFFAPLYLPALLFWLFGSGAAAAVWLIFVGLMYAFIIISALAGPRKDSE